MISPKQGSRYFLNTFPKALITYDAPRNTPEMRSRRIPNRSPKLPWLTTFPATHLNSPSRKIPWPHTVPRHSPNRFPASFRYLRHSPRRTPKLLSRDTPQTAFPQTPVASNRYVERLRTLCERKTHDVIILPPQEPHLETRILLLRAFGKKENNERNYNFQVSISFTNDIFEFFK